MGGAWRPRQLRTRFICLGPDGRALVDKIRKGVPRQEIPMEVNPKIEFVINLKVGQALGLTLAPEVLYQADRIIR